MAIKAENKIHKSLIKRTSQGGKRPRLSGMNKNTRRSLKAYRGQGR